MISEFTNQIMKIPQLFGQSIAQQNLYILSPFIQLCILAIILFVFYKKFLKGTSSEIMCKGVAILFLVWFLGEILYKFNLLILGSFLKATTTVIAISLIVIFQPELRRLLSQMGQSAFLKKLFLPNKKESTYEKKVNILQELTETVKYLSKNKMGGLIVLQNNGNQTPLSEVGTRIDAVISSELLITMFFPNTPLHDGAVVLMGEKIVAAGVLLPLTEDPKLSWQYGTRHRAAIGVTEVHNCACIVVSEETGDISMTLGGNLKKYESIADFKTGLKQILKIEQEMNTKEAGHHNLLNFLNLNSKK